MNDAVRNQEGVSAYDFNRFGVAGVGGATSVKYARQPVCPRQQADPFGYEPQLCGTRHVYACYRSASFGFGLLPDS